MNSQHLRILQHDPVGSLYKRLRLRWSPSANTHVPRPGQYVHVLPGPTAFWPSCDPLLRRAFSIMRTGSETPDEPGDPGWFDILYRVGGRGTQMLSQRQVGEEVDVLGPLGNGFSNRASREPLLLVGGGIGVPPMVFAAQSVSRETTKRHGQEIEAFVGARSRADLVGVEELRAFEAEVFVATDDGSEGRHGLVTGPLQERLEFWRAHGRSPQVWACGPWPMLRAVALVCAQAGVGCQVSMEESMPCGIGVCNGCVVPVLGAGDEFGRYKRICVEGPVLDATEVDWGLPMLAPQGPSLAGAVSDNTSDSEHAGASQ